MSAANSQSSLSPSSSGAEEESFKEPSQSKLKFYTSDEIVIHNSPEDFWVTVNQVVFDLTSMIQRKPKPLSATIQYLLAFGGKDLSSYFDESNMPKLQVSTFTGKKVPIFPAAIEKLEEDGKYWWEDEKYQIGRLTRLERPIRIINTLTAKVHKMVVCDEDTIADIQLKYRFRREKIYFFGGRNEEDKLSKRASNYSAVGTLTAGITLSEIVSSKILGQFLQKRKR